MRLFVAVWPSPEVVDVLEGLDRPELPSVRWTAADQWHVTLRFLGEVDDSALADVTAALGAAGRLPPRTVEIGPAVSRLGRHVLVVPVAGVDDLADAVVEATRTFGDPPDDRPFTPHLTLARGRRGRPIPPGMAGEPVQAAWAVAHLALVRSRLASAGARYETIATVALRPSPSSGPR